MIVAGLRAYTQSNIYKVFSIKGNVAAQYPLHRGDTLDLQTKVHLGEKSLIKIIDNKTIIYLYDESGTYTVKHIIKNPKRYYGSIEPPVNRTSLGGGSRGNFTKINIQSIIFHFINPDTEKRLDEEEFLSDENYPFYFQIANQCDSAVYANIFMVFENGEIESYLDDFLIINPREEISFPQLQLCYSRNNNIIYKLYVSAHPIPVERLQDSDFLKNPQSLYPDIMVKEFNPAE
jgi:hypothetical protein